MASRLLAYDPELETFEGETAAPPPSGHGHLREMARATALLELRDAPALHSFLHEAAREAARAERMPGAHAALAAAIRQLEATLVAALRATPPHRRLGPFGATLGSRLVALAGSRFGLEMEGLSREDQEFQIARRLVRFVAAALRGAARDAGPDPEAAARRALAAAAARLAPGLVHSLTPPLASPPPGLPGRAPAPARTIGVPPAPPGRPSLSHRPPPARRSSQEAVMHNIDRNMLEFGHEGETFESEQFEWPQGETEYGQTEGWFGEYQGEGEGEWGYEVFSEQEMMELAGELLEVQSEEELDQFLGKLIRKAGQAVGSAIRSPIGRALGGVLKGVAKKALPLAGTALGTAVGGPLGGMIGRGLASAAGSALGLEQEMMAQEDREFAGATQFVKLAGQTVQQAVDGGGDPRQAAQAAAREAARRHAPGLLAARRSAGGGQSGRWIRRGTRIVLLGV